MKTAVIMVRDLNWIKVRQNHKTWFFNANDLLEIYNSQSDKQKELWVYMKSKSLKELQEAVIKDEISNTNESRYLNSSNLKGKEISTIETKRWRVNWWTWMHPYIFMDFAMWLSADFKVTCLKWLYDNLIQFRDQCGDWFKEVNSALFNKTPNIPPFEYSNEAKMINKLVFWKPNKWQRNKATEEELSLLKWLQKADVKLIKKWLDYYERFEELKKVKNIIQLTY